MRKPWTVVRIDHPPHGHGFSSLRSRPPLFLLRRTKLKGVYFHRRVSYWTQVTNITMVWQYTCTFPLYFVLDVFFLLPQIMNTKWWCCVVVLWCCVAIPRTFFLSMKYEAIDTSLDATNVHVLVLIERIASPRPRKTRLYYFHLWFFEEGTNNRRTFCMKLVWRYFRTVCSSHCCLVEYSCAVEFQYFLVLLENETGLGPGLWHT